MLIHRNQAGSGPTSGNHPVGDEDRAEAAFYEAQMAHGHDSAEAFVASWYWRQLRHANRLRTERARSTSIDGRFRPAA